MAPVCVSRAICARPKAVAFVALAAAAGALLLPTQAAFASLIFSNVTVTGSLSPGVTFATTTGDIDFSMTSSRVGDPTDPIRDGNLVITYVATNVGQGDMLSNMNVSILGALAGTGQIYFDELIEDNITGDHLGSFSAVISANNQLPFSAVFPFTPSNQIKVKKTFYLIALAGPQLDFAQLSLVEQRITTPAPGAIALTGLGGLFALRRRRR